MATRTVTEVIARLGETAVRPVFIVARGAATDDDLRVLERYAYEIANPCILDNGSICTMPAPGATQPHCLLVKMHGHVDR